MNPSGSECLFIIILAELQLQFQCYICSNYWHHTNITIFLGVVIIRCDIVKGKGSNNLVRPGFDAAVPRNAENYVLDLGNIGKSSVMFRCCGTKTP